MATRVAETYSRHAMFIIQCEVFLDIYTLLLVSLLYRIHYLSFYWYLLSKRKDGIQRRTMYSTHDFFFHMYNWRKSSEGFFHLQSSGSYWWNSERVGCRSTEWLELTLIQDTREDYIYRVDLVKNWGIIRRDSFEKFSSLAVGGGRGVGGFARVSSEHEFDTQGTAHRHIFV
jgi:hypothetical protein